MQKTTILLMTVLSIAVVQPVLAGDRNGAGSIELAQFFNDLPGVQPQEPLNAPSDVVCEQVLQRREGTEPTNGQRYDILNRCSHKGGPEFQSPQLPLSLEREKRGLGY